MSTVLYITVLIAGLMAGFPESVLAAGGDHAEALNLTTHWVGFTALAIFVIAYGLVMAEEFTHMRKSKPVLLAAGIIWGIIAWVYASNNMPHAAEVAIRHNILE